MQHAAFLSTSSNKFEGRGAFEEYMRLLIRQEVDQQMKLSMKEEFQPLKEVDEVGRLRQEEKIQQLKLKKLKIEKAIRGWELNFEIVRICNEYGRGVIIWLLIAGIVAIAYS